MTTGTTTCRPQFKRMSQTLPPYSKYREGL